MHLTLNTKTSHRVTFPGPGGGHVSAACVFALQAVFDIWIESGRPVMMLSYMVGMLMRSYPTCRHFGHARINNGYYINLCLYVITTPHVDEQIHCEHAQLKPIKVNV